MRFQDLQDVAPWGRSLDEYVRIFELTPGDLKLRILDCGAGPASFTAEATERAYSVVPCDPIYRFSADDIQRRVHEVYPVMLAGMQAERDRFVWTHTGSPEQVAERRLEAMRRFLEDLPLGLQEGRYVGESLPPLPFADDSFDLALSSHFLFLYSDHLTADFHCAAVAEMLRVARGSGWERLPARRAGDARPAQARLPCRVGQDRVRVPEGREPTDAHSPKRGEPAEDDTKQEGKGSVIPLAA